MITSLIVVAGSGLFALVHFSTPGTEMEASAVTPTVAAPATGDQSPTVSAAVITGGTFRAGIVGRVETLNPLLAQTTAEATVDQLLFEGLVWVDGSGLPQPELAEQWQVSDDGYTYTVQLRRDVLWHDGQPFTARDVLFTVRLIQDPSFPGDASLAMFWRSVEVEVVDAYTVRFRLIEPYAPFLTHLTLPILPEHVLAGTLAADLSKNAFSTRPIGTGPFMVDTIDLEKGSIELVRSPHFDRPVPMFDRVVVQLYENSEEALAAFRHGEIDALDLVPWPAVRDPRLVGDRARVYAPLLAGYTALFLNNQAQLFADVRVRQAIAAAIDRVALVRDVLGGEGEPGNGPIPPTSWAFQEQEYRYDPGMARQLLHDAGWEDRNGDGILEQGGLNFRFTLLVNVDDPLRVAVAEAVARQLGEVGIAVSVQPVPAQTLQRQLLNREYTAALFGWMSSTGDPDSFELWHSSQADIGTNVTGFRNRTVDVLLEEARRSTDQAERRSLYVEFQRLFAEYVPAVVLYYPRYSFVVSDRIGGVDASPLIKPEDHIHQLPRWYRIQE
ncbi:peptide ABC transporter substrate-binding protein [Thermomicrobium sp. 4228-Ro]|uniref:peptide ABC transporter substrate-binding protein n=1 Tax=Thermomicrobium sp. 4228-Ro TaxID=2993937 RepID=UPI0022489A98|nr:peptide ABC transporter substrate-binding protein [Thermomicrobium sp. 4228-Ro]MCX2726128.1 peptide ABC transporter substrate-binding protein [Thermomicrobium sp. 4228-Ro]